MNTELRIRSQPAIKVHSEVAEPLAPSPQLNASKSPNLCVRMAYGVGNIVKKFGLGVAATIIKSSPAFIGDSIIEKLGLGRVELIPTAPIANWVAMVGGNGLNGIVESANAICPVKEFVRQSNLYQDIPVFQRSVPLLKAALLEGIGINAPIIEEVIFRGLIQDVFLTRVPKYIAKKIAPGTETALDSNIAKVARIVLTAVLFSAIHIPNYGALPSSYVDMQLASTFVLGIVLGALKESRAGLLGAMGAHITNNIIAISPILLSC
ncbi:MAG: CPBP family intramembrane metalloprotease [Chlamydiales bacterium]|nr:CPBP family intramembrane metalloprotease [Chlamydiales bacterium]